METDLLVSERNTSSKPTFPRQADESSTPADNANAEASERSDLSRQASADSGDARSNTAAVLELLVRSLRQDDFQAAALAVTNALASTLDCVRVSLGMHGLRRIEVCAISNTADVARRQTAVRQIRAAMQEAVDMRTLMVFPAIGKRPATTAFMHATLARQSGRTAICTVPILVQGAIAGALTIERDADIDTDLVEKLKDAACIVGPVLALQYRISRPVAGLFMSRQGKVRAGRSGALLSLPEGVAMGCAALLVAAAFWPTTFTISSPAVVEGEGQQVVAAPVDGFIKTVLHQPGDQVEAGELLVTLNDEELKREFDKWQVEVRQLDRSYREALSKEDAAEIVLARAKRDQAIVQLQLAEYELTQTQLVAPIDGFVVSGDLSDALGSPVERGQELFKIAPADAYRIVAQVDEQDIAMIKPGQVGEVLFAALGDQSMQVETGRVSPVAQTVDQRNMFEVDNRLLGELPTLYHGMTGVARIDIDERTLGSIVWLRLGQKIKRLTWRLIG